MNNYDICKLLIQSGADVEDVDHGGKTPLYDAADMEPVDLLEELAVKWVSLNSDPIELGKE